jgi:hypothetical protein
MDWNIYVGANIDAILAVPPEQIPFAVAQAWADVQSTNFPERAEAIADRVAAERPHLIGLQEVSLFRTQSPGDFLIGNPTPATDVALDFLEVLMDALAARGLDYAPVAITTNFDLEVPIFTGVGLDDIRLTDHDVILARSDVSVTNVREENFATNLQVPLGGQVLTLLRGWNSVDATIGRRTIRFVNTHLEPPEIAPAVQVAQGQELIAALADGELPTVLVGDLNSAADGSSTPTIFDFLDAGFLDAWTQGRPRGDGFTCCQDPLLQNAVSELVKRIDYVLVRDAFRTGPIVGAVEIGRLGAEPADKTPSGLWPSDHAGLAARFQLPLQP